MRDPDETDRALMAHLARDGRASIETLSQTLGLGRATVRARLRRLEEAGEIAGYRAVLRAQVRGHPVRGIVCLGIEGPGAARIVRALLSMPEVAAVHSTHGRWDVVVELGTESLERLDAALEAIRRIGGVARSETSLYLTSRRGPAG
ncbi:MAG: Lrp/AsnC family transcriptional regulator [Paracoccaceae bacterium]